MNINICIIILLIIVQCVNGTSDVNRKLSKEYTTLTYNPTEKRTYNPTEKRTYNPTEERTRNPTIRKKSRRIDESTLEPTEEPTYIVYKTRSPNVYRTRSPTSEPSLDSAPTEYPLLFQPDAEEPIVNNDREDEPTSADMTRVPTDSVNTTEPLAIGIVLGAAVILIGVVLFILLGSQWDDKIDSPTEETITTNPEGNNIMITENSPLIGQI